MVRRRSDGLGPEGSKVRECSNDAIIILLSLRVLMSERTAYPALLRARNVAGLLSGRESGPCGMPDALARAARYAESLTVITAHNDPPVDNSKPTTTEVSAIT